MAEELPIVKFEETMNGLRSKNTKRVGNRRDSSQFQFQVAPGDEASWRIVAYPHGATEEHKHVLGVGLYLVQCPYSTIKVRFLVTVRIHIDRNVQTPGSSRDLTTFSRDLTAQFTKGSPINVHHFSEVTQSLLKNPVSVECAIFSCEIIGNNQCERRVIHADAFLVQLYDAMYVKQNLTDLQLTVNGQGNVSREFNVHRAVIAAHSPVFNAMLQHELQEKIQSKIDISDFKPNVVEQFIKFAYTGLCDVTTDGLFVFADKYGIDSLKRACEKTLASSVTWENAVRMLLFADAHSAPLLKVAAMDCVDKFASQVMATEEWRSLSQQLLNDIIKHITCSNGSESSAKKKRNS